MTLHVAVDGSAHGSQIGSFGPAEAGYGFVVSESVYEYGPVGDTEYHELAAVEAALDAFVGLSLVIYSDCHEVLLRLSGCRRPPKDRAKYRSHWISVMRKVEDRGDDVQFIRVMPEVTSVPLHSAAHYLAFLGRTQVSVSPGQVSENIATILAGRNSESVARKLITAHLFPDRHPSRSRKVVPERLPSEFDPSKI